MDALLDLAPDYFPELLVEKREGAPSDLILSLESQVDTNSSGDLGNIKSRLQEVLPTPFMSSFLTGDGKSRATRTFPC